MTRDQKNYMAYDDVVETNLTTRFTDEPSCQL